MVSSQAVSGSKHHYLNSQPPWNLRAILLDFSLAFLYVSNAQMDTKSFLKESMFLDGLEFSANSKGDLPGVGSQLDPALFALGIPSGM